MCACACMFMTIKATGVISLGSGFQMARHSSSGGGATVLIVRVYPDIDLYIK